MTFGRFFYIIYLQYYSFVHSTYKTIRRVHTYGENRRKKEHHSVFDSSHRGPHDFSGGQQETGQQRVCYVVSTTHKRRYE